MIRVTERVTVKVTDKVTDSKQKPLPLLANDPEYTALLLTKLNVLVQTALRFSFTFPIPQPWPFQSLPAKIISKPSYWHSSSILFDYGK